MSSIGWVAFSEGERKRTLDILSAFSESGTLDELGIGRVRDAFSDLLFPGTSTIQTRARYFLIIPWIYRELEGRSPVSNALTRARQYEVKLIELFRQQMAVGEGDTVGVIGGTAGADLVQLPSQIYWQGLSRWGIRSRLGQRAAYHRLLGARNFGLLARGEELDPLASDPSWWDSGLPPEPDDLWVAPTLELEPTEAAYLREMVTIQVSGTLLAALVSRGELLPDAKLPWQLPAEFKDALLSDVAEQLSHAENFSLAMNGATILFNLMIAERKTEGAKFIDTYREDFTDWAASVQSRSGALEEWFGSSEAREKFWSTARMGNPRLPGVREKQFIENWITRSIESPGSLMEDAEVRQLIAQRELHLKGPSRAKLRSASALEAWNGGPGASPLDFRWGTVRTLVNDIAHGIAIEDSSDSRETIART
jgi:hypothetical protein